MGQTLSKQQQFLAVGATALAVGGLVLWVNNHSSKDASDASESWETPTKTAAATPAAIGSSTTFPSQLEGRPPTAPFEQAERQDNTASTSVFLGVSIPVNNLFSRLFCPFGATYDSLAEPRPPAAVVALPQPRESCCPSDSLPPLEEFKEKPLLGRTIHIPLPVGPDGGEPETFEAYVVGQPRDGRCIVVAHDIYGFMSGRISTVSWSVA